MQSQLTGLISISPKGAWTAARWRFSLGLNWWLSPFFSVNFNYRWITLDRFGVEGKSNGFNTRLTLMLE